MRCTTLAAALFMVACGTEDKTTTPTGGAKVEDTTTTDAGTEEDTTPPPLDTGDEDTAVEADTAALDSGAPDVDTEKCTAESCDDKDACTIDSCDPAVGCSYEPAGTPECCKPGTLGASFEEGEPAVFTFKNTDAAVGWQIVPKSADGKQPNTSGALYYGNASTWTFESLDAEDSPTTNSGDAVSAPLTLPEATALTLSFKAYLDIESLAAGDQLTVSIDAGGASYVLWAKALTSTYQEWQDVTVDVSAFSGKKVKLPFTFDSIDEYFNDSFGVLIDDVSLTSTCQANACTTVADCADGLGATSDTCEGGACAYAFDAKKCESDDDCQPASACGIGMCLAHVCSTLEASNCCAKDADCDDGDGCTIDSCDVFSPTPTCTNAPDPKCCDTAADCDDENPCTTETCGDDKLCAFAPVEGCCLTASDCSDGDKCTVESCGESNTCSAVNVCCKADADCKDADNVCTNEACVEGVCATAATGAEGCCSPLSYAEDFADGPTGWTFVNSDTKAGWQVWSKPTAGTKTDSLYYGDPVKGNFDTGAASSGTATSSPIALPAGSSLTLSFSGYFDTETASEYDKFEVRVMEGGKATVLLKKSEMGPIGKFAATYTASLSKWAGKSVSLVFAFDTIDAQANGGLGILIDDIHVDGICELAACEKAADCDDENPLNIDACIQGKCAHADGLMCNGAADCDDGNLCTVDVCEPSGACNNSQILFNCCMTDVDCVGAGPCDVGTCQAETSTCEFSKKEGCCIANVECLDGNKCTQDACGPDNTCSHTGACCESDAACDDGGNACTIDKCISASCVHVNTYTEQCCTPFEAAETFDAEVVTGWTFTNSDPKIGWKIWKTPAVGASAALYYGDVDAKNFGPGVMSEGDATMAEVTLPASPDVKLSFKAYLDVEPSASYDVLTAYFQPAGGKAVQVWKRNADSPIEKVFTATADLGAFSGQKGNVIFHFETVDATANDGLGVLIDDVSISACKKPACAADADCDDLDAMTTDSCIDGICGHGYVVPECEGHAECDDQNACTADACIANACVHAAIPSCCKADSDCSDGEAKCTTEHCVAGTCLTKPTGAEGCCTPFAYSEDFDDKKADDWTLVNTDAKVGWSVWATPSEGTSAALYYGNPATKNYDAKTAGGESIASSGLATTPVIKLPAGATDATLSFKLYLDTENFDAGSINYDLFEVRVVVEGTATVLMGKAGIPLGEWTTILLPVGLYAGKDIQIELSEDTIDNLYNTSLGVLVDDFEVSTKCAPVTCAADKDCDDGALTTVEACIAGTCAIGLGAPKCDTDFQCNDDNICTADQCVAGVCAVSAIPSCCTSDDQCDDKDKCTKDACTFDGLPPVPPGVTGLCHNDPIPACQ